MADSDHSPDAGLIHSFPFYIADWRESERISILPSISKMLYVELLIVCYWKGSLPTDEAILRKLARFDVREFNKAWPDVKPFFFEQDGRMRNAKVDEIRPGLVAWREARRRGGLNRHSSTRSSSAIAEAKAKLQHQPPSSSSSSSSSSLRSEEPPIAPQRGRESKPPVARPETTTRSLTIQQAAWFAEFWQAFWKKSGKDAAMTKFGTRVRDQATFDAVMEAVRQQTTEMLGREKQFRPCPLTWLNQGRWKDEPDAPLIHGDSANGEAWYDAL